LGQEAFSLVEEVDREVGVWGACDSIRMRTILAEPWPVLSL